MENIKTYPVASEWYAQKLPNKITRALKPVLVIVLLVLVLVQIGAVLQNQAVKSAEMKNIIKYHHVEGFQPITRK